MTAVMPRVSSAEHRGGYRLYLTFHDGTAGAVDFRRWLRGVVFEPLKDPAYFQRFFVDAETVAWPNGADIAPEALYEAAKASSRVTPKGARARKNGPAKKRSRSTP